MQSLQVKWWRLTGGRKYAEAQRTLAALPDYAQFSSRAPKAIYTVMELLAYQWDGDRWVHVQPPDIDWEQWLVE